MGVGFYLPNGRKQQGGFWIWARKGFGRTPYARTADGWEFLKGAVREILANFKC